ncbi:MAG: cation transporter [Polyangiaceae bacterium]|jgi:copper chaperone CopZ|nr:cation transporter [Polyangiaceae bacterium]
MDIELKVEGMHCQACVRRVQKALEKAAGVEVVEVMVGQVRARGDRAQVEEAVTKAGFSVAG